MGPYFEQESYSYMATNRNKRGIRLNIKDQQGVTGIAIHDIAAGVTAIYAIMAAYIHKLKAGEGQYIDLSLVDSGLAWTVWESVAYFGAGNQKLWEKFCHEVIEREELVHDPRFLTNTDRRNHLDELEQVIQELLQQQDSEYWLARLDEAGVPSSPIYRYDQTLNDPHIRSREMVIEYGHPLAGNIRSLGFPAKMSATPAKVKRPAPLLGQHTREVLEELQYSEDMIRELEEKKIIIIGVEDHPGIGWLFSSESQVDPHIHESLGWNQKKYEVYNVIIFQSFFVSKLCHL